MARVWFTNGDASEVTVKWFLYAGITYLQYVSMFEISDLMVNIGELSIVDFNDLYIENRKLFASDHIQEYWKLIKIHCSFSGWRTKHHQSSSPVENVLNQTDRQPWNNLTEYTILLNTHNIWWPLVIGGFSVIPCDGRFQHIPSFEKWETRTPETNGKKYEKQICLKKVSVSRFLV